MTLNNQYKKATEWLFQQFPQYQLVGAIAFKPTLENIQQLLDWLGNPEKNLKFIHVAGSNGKGSTCSMMASILTEARYKTGLYTSPHIQDYTERIRIDGEPISKEAVVDFVQKIQQHSFNFEPSFFEITFALSIYYFHKNKCDICVIETGLGGRLDATNIINPLLSIITSISLEHTNFLGNTLEEIAREKAGIIKQNVPILIGKLPPQAHAEIQKIANEKKSPFITFNNKYEVPEKFPLLGEFQKENFFLALTGLKAISIHGFNINDQHIEKGLKNLLKNTGFYGRLQIVNNEPLTIIDVSHNVEGIKKSIEAIIPIIKGNLHIVYGTSSDKSISEIIDHFPTEATIYFTQFSNPRSASIDQLKVASKVHSFKKVDFFSNFTDAYTSAQNIAKQEDTILIIGSFFLVSDFF